MANRIKNYQYSPDESFKMSNAWTDAFYKVLLISASNLAKTDWEKDFAIWIAQHDSTYIGTGSGFDIVQIPWTKEHFEEEKAFILNVISTEKEKTGWRKAEYTEYYKTMLNFLHNFEQMIQHFTVEMIDYEKQEPVLEKTEKEKKSYKYQKCPIHNVYLHGYTEDPTKNCLICNHKVYDSHEDYLKDMRESEEYKQLIKPEKEWSIGSIFYSFIFLLLLLPFWIYEYIKKRILGR